jgi:hypothetical protein
MSPQVLQINYKFSGSGSDFEREFGPVAAEISRVPGLRWKLWLFDEAESRGGGIYLFDDEAALQGYLSGPIVAALKSHPAFSDLNVQAFTVLEQPTTLTRGPVEAMPQ